MNCSERDQDILLLEHGALGGVRRWSTERHLRNCPRCQERREQHARVSRLVGATVREAGPDLRVLYGGAAAVAVTAAAGAGRSSTVGAGRGRLRPVQPLIRPAFVGTWAAVAAIVAAGAWIYKATALAPGYEHMATPAPDIPRPTRPVGPRQSIVVPGAGGLQTATAASPSGFTSRVASAAAPSSSAASPASPPFACPSERGVGPLQQAALLPPTAVRPAAAAAPPRRGDDATGAAASAALAPSSCSR